MLFLSLYTVGELLAHIRGQMLFLSLCTVGKLLAHVRGQMLFLSLSVHCGRVTGPYSKQPCTDMPVK